MVEAVLLANGRLALPEEVRDTLKLLSGNTPEFVRSKDGYLIRKKGVNAFRLLGRFANRFERPVPVSMTDPLTDFEH